MLESELPLRSCACTGGGQGSQPAPTKPQPQPRSHSTWKDENLSFISAPSVIHPPGHAGCVLRLPAAGDAGGTHFRQALGSLIPFWRKVFKHLIGASPDPSASLPFISPRESENRKLPSGFSSSVDTSRLTDPLPPGEQAFRNKLFSTSFISMHTC